MKLPALAVIAALLGGCAAHQVSLFPRAPGTERGTGTLQRSNNDVTVKLAGAEYRGKMLVHSTASGGLFTPVGKNEMSALLLGPAGQVRCDFVFDSMWIQATGVCVDSKSITYDMLVK